MQGMKPPPKSLPPPTVGVGEETNSPTRKASCSEKNAQHLEDTLVAGDAGLFFVLNRLVVKNSCSVLCELASGIGVAQGDLQLFLFT